MSDSFATPRTVARQAVYPWDFPGKNTGMGCHFLLQGLPDPGIKPASPASPILQANFLPLSHREAPIITIDNLYCQLIMGQVVPRSPAFQADSLPAEPPGKRIQTGWACNCCHLKSVNEAGPVDCLLTESTNHTFFSRNPHKASLSNASMLFNLPLFGTV